VTLQADAIASYEWMCPRCEAEYSRLEADPDGETVECDVCGAGVTLRTVR